MEPLEQGFLAWLLQGSERTLFWLQQLTHPEIHADEAENVYATFGAGKGPLPKRQFIIMDRLIPVSTKPTHLRFH
jgi:hypothetical protein